MGSMHVPMLDDPAVGNSDVLPPISGASSRVTVRLPRAAVVHSGVPNEPGLSGVVLFRRTLDGVGWRRWCRVWARAECAPKFEPCDPGQPDFRAADQRRCEG